MITNFDVNTYVLFLDLVLCIVLGSKEVEAFNLRSWLHDKELAC